MRSVWKWRASRPNGWSVGMQRGGSGLDGAPFRRSRGQYAVQQCGKPVRRRDAVALLRARGCRSWASAVSPSGARSSPTRGLLRGRQHGQPGSRARSRPRRAGALRGAHGRPPASRCRGAGPGWSRIWPAAAMAFALDTIRRLGADVVFGNPPPRPVRDESFMIGSALSQWTCRQLHAADSGNRGQGVHACTLNASIAFDMAMCSNGRPAAFAFSAGSRALDEAAS